MGAYVTPNTFTSYKWLTDEEELLASILTNDNVQFIQTEIARIAQERLNISYDLNNTMSFVQQEAELKGKLGALQWLLDCSNQAVRYQATLQKT